MKKKKVKEIGWEDFSGGVNIEMNRKGELRKKKILKDLPPFRVYPRVQTQYEKKMAKHTEKLLNYMYAQAEGSILLQTPWGVLMWTPALSKKSGGKE